MHVETLADLCSACLVSIRVKLDNFVSMFNCTDNSDHCVAHLINEVTVNGENTVIEWQATGNGAGNVPTFCKIRGVTRFFPCKCMKE